MSKRERDRVNERVNERENERETDSLFENRIHSFYWCSGSRLLLSLWERERT
jgi:hypothetical protein